MIKMVLRSMKKRVGVSEEGSMRGIETGLHGGEREEGSISSLGSSFGAESGPSELRERWKPEDLVPLPLRNR